MAGLKTCACGEPTYSTECAMCASDKGLFQPPTRPAPPMPKIKTARPDYETMLRDEFAGAVRHVLAGAGLRGNLDDAVRDVVQSLIDKGLV